MASVRDICEFFWQLEQKHNLLDSEIRGVKYWQYLRMELYFALARATGVLDRPHHGRQSLPARVALIPAYLKSSLKRNPLRGNHIVDTVVIDHPRHKAVDGRNIDIYTWYYLQDLQARDQSFEVLELPYLGRHVKTMTPNRKYTDYFALRAAVGRLLRPIRPSPEESSQVQRLADEIKATWETQIPLKRMIIDGISRFHTYYPLYRRYFQKRQPGQVVLVVSYGQGEAIKAARDLGITTIELQHGSFSQYHLGYSFPGRRDELDYFPDEFHVWSEFWRDFMELPVPRDRVRVTGFPHLERVRKRYADVPRRSGQLLVLSQGSVGARLAERLWQDKDRLEGLNITYKLHPGEYGRWQEYSSLARLSKLPNVTVVEDTDLYRCFAESEYQLGVYSTAVYEGREFGCKTILMDLPGIEYMARLLEEDDVLPYDRFLQQLA